MRLAAVAFCAAVAFAIAAGCFDSRAGDEHHLRHCCVTSDKGRQVGAVGPAVAQGVAVAGSWVTR